MLKSICMPGNLTDIVVGVCKRDAQSPLNGPHCKMLHLWPQNKKEGEEDLIVTNKFFLLSCVGLDLEVIAMPSYDLKAEA